jgi:hypothetical protein
LKNLSHGPRRLRPGFTGGAVESVHEGRELRWKVTCNAELEQGRSEGMSGQSGQRCGTRRSLGMIVTKDQANCAPSCTGSIFLDFLYAKRSGDRRLRPAAQLTSPAPHSAPPPFDMRPRTPPRCHAAPRRGSTSTAHTATFFPRLTRTAHPPCALWTKNAAGRSRGGRGGHVSRREAGGRLIQKCIASFSDVLCICLSRTRTPSPYLQDLMPTRAAICSITYYNKNQDLRILPSVRERHPGHPTRAPPETRGGRVRIV